MVNIFNKITNIFKKRYITIESDRDSVCAGDDMSRHNVFTVFPEKMNIKELISELMKIHTIVSNSAIWAGSHNNYKCIRDCNGNWLTNEKATLKSFFKDTDRYVFFDRESFGTKCKK